MKNTVLSPEIQPFTATIFFIATTVAQSLVSLPEKYRNQDKPGFSMEISVPAHSCPNFCDHRSNFHNQKNYKIFLRKKERCDENMTLSLKKW